MSATTKYAYHPMDAPVGKWTTVRTHRQNGHAVYRDNAGRIALADNSGHFPENTDDGIMWLDTNAVIEVGDQHCRLSVRDTKAAEFGTFVSPADALWYAVTFDMVLQAEAGRRYQVNKISPSGRVR